MKNQVPTMKIINLPIKKGVIIGSYALGTRYAKDIDVVCMESDILCEYTKKNDYTAFFKYNGRQVECLLADKVESLGVIYNHYGEGICIASIPIQFCIKAGHIIFPHKNWDKHIQDYHILYNMLDNEPSSTLIAVHRQCTKERLGIKKGTPKLIGVTKDKFFEDKVVKYYVHDNIHRSIAHNPGHPKYELMQHNTNLVECDEELWNKMSYEDKVMCVLEEAYTIALERKIIPIMKGQAGIIVSNFDAFKWALMRICTTLCSGWFRQYSIDNYFIILNQYDPEYVDKFEANIGKYEFT